MDSHSARVTRALDALPAMGAGQDRQDRTPPHQEAAHAP